MANSKVKVYVLKDANVAFSECGLERDRMLKNACTKPIEIYNDKEKWYECGYGGIHLRCIKHVDTILRRKTICADGSGVGDIWQGDAEWTSRDVWWCEKCAENNSKYTGCEICEPEQDLYERARILIQRDSADCDILYIDEYSKEIRIEHPKEENNSEYFACGKVESDFYGNPRIHLYVGKKTQKKKAHYFIEPKNGSVRYEIGGNNKDVDPGSIISEITVKFNNRTITHNYQKDSTNEK